MGNFRLSLTPSDTNYILPYSRITDSNPVQTLSPNQVINVIERFRESGIASIDNNTAPSHAYSWASLNDFESVLRGRLRKIQTQTRGSILNILRYFFGLQTKSHRELDVEANYLTQFLQIIKNVQLQLEKQKAEKATQNALDAASRSTTAISLLQDVMRASEKVGTAHSLSEARQGAVLALNLSTHTEKLAIDHPDQIWVPYFNGQQRVPVPPNQAVPQVNQPMQPPEPPPAPATTDAPVAPEPPPPPEAPAAPDAPDAPQAPEAPAAPDAPEAPEAPTAPDAPDAPDAPAAPNAPDTTTAPAVPIPAASGPRGLAKILLIGVAPPAVNSIQWPDTLNPCLVYLTREADQVRFRAAVSEGCPAEPTCLRLSSSVILGETNVATLEGYLAELKVYKEKYKKYLDPFRQLVRVYESYVTSLNERIVNTRNKIVRLQGAKVLIEKRVENLQRAQEGTVGLPYTFSNSTGKHIITLYSDSMVAQAKAQGRIVDKRLTISFWKDEIKGHIELADERIQEEQDSLRNSEADVIQATALHIALTALKESQFIPHYKLDTFAIQFSTMVKKRIEALQGTPAQGPSSGPITLNDPRTKEQLFLDFYTMQATMQGGVSDLTNEILGKKINLD